MEFEASINTNLTEEKHFILLRKSSCSSDSVLFSDELKRTGSEVTSVRTEERSRVKNGRAVGKRV